MSTDHRGSLDHSVPQWKRDLILRRRAVGRVLPAGSGSVQLTCPSVVVAVRYPEYSLPSNSHGAHERDLATARKNMRLVEQVNISGDFVADSGLGLDFKKYSKPETCAGNYLLSMGEEKRCKKKKKSEAGKKAFEHLVIEDDSLSDSSEELKYGPGIVSRLKSRYLSLTLRESQGRNRPTLPYMRRATSLENILDGPPIEKLDLSKQKYVKNVNNTVNGNVTERYRSATRGNKDNMKRAGSVETLIRYDKGKGGHCNRTNYELPKGIENREPQEKKLTRNTISSAVEEELPPPDVVKHTLKIFENSTNATKNFHLSKLTSVTKSLNNSNLVCGKKPTVFPKPVVSNNVKSFGLNVMNSENDRNSNDKSAKVAKSEEDFLCERKSSKLCVEKQSVEKTAKPIIMKEMCNDSAGTASISSQTGEFSSDDIDGEGVCKAAVTIPPNSTDIGSFITNNSVDNQNNNKQKTRGASPDEEERGVNVSTESMRSLSPVLVRAPQCIISSEVNANNPNFPAQHHMKQLGVVRPIVTNKTSHSGQSFSNAKCSQNKPNFVLTEREIEKNLINSVKSIEQPVTKVIVSLKKSPEECIVPCANDVKQNEENRRGLIWDARKPNTMVFNFSNRKTVPDYIENDGLILTSRKDKPKRGEPGIIFLGGSTYDSSTDFDPEDLHSGPPSPCDFTFEGDNILINGKSNIQSKPKLRKMKIQFNDEATTMFEYPSEASLLVDHEGIGVNTETETAQNSSPLNGCSGLASYTPSKVSLSSDFELGVTRTNASPQAPPKQPEESVEPPEAEECLRPADDSNTVTWSSETAADLLF